MAPAKIVKLDIKGIKTTTSFEYEDERGTCRFSYAGKFPELPGTTFHYSDDDYHFLFCADIKYAENDTIFDIVVSHATTKRYQGETPRIHLVNIGSIRRSMERFFSERDFLNPDEPVPPTAHFRNLILEWDVIMKPGTPFKPKMKGIGRRTFFEYEDERGKCYLASVGGRPELPGRPFYYSDDTYEFCFYANQIWDGKDTYDVEVNDARTQAGNRPRIDHADIGRIRRNMEKFFSERDFLTPHDQPVSPTVHFRNLILTWRLP